MDIFTVAGDLVQQYGGVKNFPSSQVDMSSMQQNGALSPVWFLRILAHVKNL